MSPERTPGGGIARAFQSASGNVDRRVFVIRAGDTGASEQYDSEIDSLDGVVSEPQCMYSLGPRTSANVG
ncbi:hypothetical protein GCM10009792_12300 [Microcella alkalica]